MFSQNWKDTHAKNAVWPANFKVLNDKLFFFEERLCIPTGRVVEVINAHHSWNAHQSADRLVPELFICYKFPDSVDVPGTLKTIKRACYTCQQCQAPSWALKGPIVMTPIPPRVWTSVSLDIFQMPEVQHLGQKFDAFLMCVDRHNGWMVARPTQYDGLTGEKAAHLLLDHSWGELGVPSIITSDQGSHFISQWWETMCTRLGVRQAFSHAYLQWTRGSRWAGAKRYPPQNA